LKFGAVKFVFLVNKVLFFNVAGNSDITIPIIKQLINKPIIPVTIKTREYRASFRAWGAAVISMPSVQLDQMKKRLRPNELSILETSLAYYNGDVWHEEKLDKIEPASETIGNVPIIILIGNNTGSAAESFLLQMLQIENVTLVGQRTYGAMGQPLYFKLVGGASARVNTVRFAYLDDKEIDGKGIEPHIKINPTVNDIVENRDIALEKAVEILTSKLQ
jgi:hypothetical protein